jgi:hypothetical protein
MTQPDPRVSAVVITHDHWDEVLANLGRFSRLPERPPIILVDNASTDGTADAAAARFPDVTVIRSGNNLGAAGRNLGVRRAGTPYAAFRDDPWPDPGCLRHADHPIMFRLKSEAEHGWVVDRRGATRV